MKKQWKNLQLEVLDISKTMAGAGIKTPDSWNDDPDKAEADHYS